MLRISATRSLLAPRRAPWFASQCREFAHVARAAARPRDAGPSEAVRRLAKQPNTLPICVVDAADFEGSALARRTLQEAVGPRPIVLAINKCDRMPRLDEHDLRYFRSRFALRHPNELIGLHGVSAHTGAGLAELAQRAREARGDVLLFGSTGSGKSSLARALAAAIEGLDAGLVDADADAAGALLLLGGSTPGPSAAAEPHACFGADSARTLWDSPGLPPERTVASRLPADVAPPSALVGTSAARGRVKQPKSMFAAAGESVVLTAADDDTDEIALARIDVVDATAPPKRGKAAASDDAEKADNPFFDVQRVVVSPYLIPTVSVAVVKTEEAPDALHIARATADGGEAGETVARPYEDVRLERNGAAVTAVFQKAQQCYALDLALGGVGHIGFHHRAPFVLSARAPAEFGASFWLRRPMYPRVLTVPPHWKPEAIAQGLKRGELLEGTMLQRRPGSATVTGAGGAELAAITLRGRNAINRALDGDRVAIRLLPKALWVRPGALDDDDAAAPEAALDDPLVDAGGDVLADAATIDAAAEPPAAPSWNFLENGGEGGVSPTERPPRPCAEVVGIVARSDKPFIGVLDPATAGRRDQYVAPRRQTMPRVRMPLPEVGELVADTLYAVKVDTWGAAHRFPTGKLDRALGAVGDLAAESEAILVESAVDKDAKFSDEALAALPGAAWRVDEAEAARRLDLREGAVGEAVCSVDPPGCVDIDDALHAVEVAAAADGTRRFEVGVHIADVGHFITAGAALDTESSKRGTTFYLVDQRVNMVPEVLAEDVASLHANHDRLAFSVLWTIDEHANLLESAVRKTVIRSRASLSYADAQQKIDAQANGGGGGDALSSSLGILHSLALKLQAERIAGGALRLASPEVKFEKAADDGAAAAVAASEAASEGASEGSMGLYMPLASNSMVEEFMLLANVTVAKLIREAFPQSALLRRHPHPQAADFARLHDQLQRHGAALDLSSPTALAASLDGAAKPNEPYFNLLVRCMAVRCMPSAEYVCAGEMASLNESTYHFGLATPLYTHFTSPIRRYADQVVHRMAAVAVGWDEPSEELADAPRLGELARSLNERHQAAKQAERASVSLHALRFFRAEPVVADAYATFVTAQGFTCLVPRFGLEAFVHAWPRDGGPSPFRFNVSEKTLSCPGRTIRTLDRVTVRIAVDTSRLHPQLKVELLDEESGTPLLDVLAAKSE